MALPNSEDIRFDSRWFQGVPAEEVESLKARLLGDKKTLDNIRKIVYNIVTKERDIRKVDYDSPSWSHKQAHKNGMLEAFNSIMRLVTLDKEVIHEEKIDG